MLAGLGKGNFVCIFMWPATTCRDGLDRTYFVGTEIWKYYNKIIFKYVNSTIRPIFNKKNYLKMKFVDKMAEKSTN